MTVKAPLTVFLCPVLLAAVPASARAADTTKPTAAWTAPAAGATVKGKVTLAAGAADNVKVARVVFRNGSATVLGVDTTSPYSYSWDTTKVPDGSYTLKINAADTSGNQSAPVARTVVVHNAAPPPPPSCAPVANAWVKPQVQQTANEYLYTPLSDSAAAACVSAKGEAVPANAGANRYLPTSTELSAFQALKDSNGLTPEQEFWYGRYVTGRPGLANPTTDELIQWGSHKWGIPEDWLRAQYTQESVWRQSQQGDIRTETPADYQKYPKFSCPNPTQCNESLGITQEKWRPDGSVGGGTDPLRYESVAFNIDYQAAYIRFQHDNPYGKRSAWGDASYAPLQDWLSLGAWFSPYPFNNSGQQSYVSLVQGHLSRRDWPASP